MHWHGRLNVPRPERVAWKSEVTRQADEYAFDIKGEGNVFEFKLEK